MRIDKVDGLDMKVNYGDMKVTSPSFAHGGPIPDDLVASGQSPALEWTQTPQGTASFALVVTDPDGPVLEPFVHWVVYNIPADATGLLQGATTGFTTGSNSAGTDTYLPPGSPPGDGAHHYFFHLYALTEGEPLEAGLTRAALLRRIDERVLVQSRLVGTWENREIPR